MPKKTNDFNPTHKTKMDMVNASKKINKDNTGKDKSNPFVLNIPEEYIEALQNENKYLEQYRGTKVTIKFMSGEEYDGEIFAYDLIAIWFRRENGEELRLPELWIKEILVIEEG